MPARVAALVEAELDDPDSYRSLREIALMGARSREILERLDEAGSRQLVKAARESTNAAREKLLKGDVTAADQLLANVDEAFARAQDDFRLWDELMSIWKLRADVIESENRNDYRRATVVSDAELAHIIGVILSLLREFVPDRDRLYEFSMELERRIPSAFATTGTIARARKEETDV